MDDKEISFGGFASTASRSIFLLSSEEKYGVDEQVFKVRLGGALSNLIWSKKSLSMVNKMD